MNLKQVRQGSRHLLGTHCAPSTVTSWGDGKGRRDIFPARRAHWFRKKGSQETALLVGVLARDSSTRPPPRPLPVSLIASSQGIFKEAQRTEHVPVVGPSASASDASRPGKRDSLPVPLDTEKPTVGSLRTNCPQRCPRANPQNL